VAFTPGDWVELVRDVPGASTGQRGKVTSTGFFGGLDIHLENGNRVRGVDASAVVASGPSNIHASSGPGRSSTALFLVVAVLVAIAVGVWLGWGR
jgi:hypothetical protein